jgi:hypothetical protein
MDVISQRSRNATKKPLHKKKTVWRNKTHSPDSYENPQLFNIWNQHTLRFPIPDEFTSALLANGPCKKDIAHFSNSIPVLVKGLNLRRFDMQD